MGRMGTCALVLYNRPFYPPPPLRDEETRPKGLCRGEGLFWVMIHKLYFTRYNGCNTCNGNMNGKTFYTIC